MTERPVVSAYFDGLCEPPSETDKAWMAGFVDGEGYVSISCQVRKNRPSPAFRAQVGVGNTRRDVLDGFVSHYGGHVYEIHERRHDKRGVKWADAYDWYCPVSSCERFLTDILPYLRIKREQAELVLEFIRTKDGFERTHWPGRGKGSAPLTAEEISHRERLKARVQSLNAKGKVARQETGKSI